MKRLITILGPTASGKTQIATALAARVGGEIISADSRQVYRRMDIGTGKDLSDYVNPETGEKIPYHLIDIVEPGTKYNLYQYQEDFRKAYEDIVARGAQPILCGGTGLYIEAVLKGYNLPDVPENPELRKSLKGKSLEELTQILIELKKQTGSTMHNKTDVDSCQRAIRAIEIEQFAIQTPSRSNLLACQSKNSPQGGEIGSRATLIKQEKDSSPLGSCPPITGVIGRTLVLRLPEQEPKGVQRPLRTGRGIDSLIIGVDIDRELRRRKITQRLHARLEEGMVDEIRGLLSEGIPPENLIYYGLEYKFLTQYVIGVLTYDEMVSRLEIAIHQFAKRQMTWFRGMERRGFKIHWVKRPEDDAQLDRVVEEIMSYE